MIEYNFASPPSRNRNSSSKMSSSSGVVLTQDEFKRRARMLEAAKATIQDECPEFARELQSRLQALFTSAGSNFRSLLPTHEPPASNVQERPEVSAEAMAVITLKMILALVSVDPVKSPPAAAIVSKNIKVLVKAVCEYLEFSVKQLSTHIGSVEGGAAEDEEVDAIFTAPTAFDGALAEVANGSDEKGVDPQASRNPHKSLFAAYKNHPRLLSAQVLLCLTRYYQICDESSTSNPSLLVRLSVVVEACVTSHAKLVVSHGSLPPGIQRQVKHFPLDGIPSPVYCGSLVSNANRGSGGSSRLTDIHSSRGKASEGKPIFTNGVIRAAFHHKLSQNVTFLVTLAMVNAVNVWGQVLNEKNTFVENASTLRNHPFGNQFVTWIGVLKTKIMDVAVTNVNTSGSLVNGRSNTTTIPHKSEQLDVAYNPLVVRSVDGYVSILTLAVGMLRTAQGDRDKGLDYIVDSFRGDRRELNMPEGDFASAAAVGGHQGVDGSRSAGGLRTKLGGALSALSGGNSSGGNNAASRKSSVNQNPILASTSPIHFQGKVCKRLVQLCPDAVSDLQIPPKVIPSILFDLVNQLTEPEILPALKHIADLDCSSYGHYMATLEQFSAAQNDVIRRRQQQQQQNIGSAQHLGTLNSQGNIGASTQPLNLPLAASVAYPYTSNMSHLCDLLSLIFRNLPASYLRVPNSPPSHVVHYGHSEGRMERTTVAGAHNGAFSGGSGLQQQHQSASTAILSADEQEAISHQDNGVAVFVFRNMVLHLQAVFQEYKPTANTSTTAMIGLAASGGVTRNGDGSMMPNFDGIGKSRATKAMDDLWESYTTKLMGSYVELLATVAGLDESLAARVFVAVMGDGQVELPELQWSSIIRQCTLAMLIPDFTSSNVGASGAAETAALGNSNGGRLGGGIAYSDPNTAQFSTSLDSNANNGTNNVVQFVLYNGANADSRLTLNRIFTPYAFGSIKGNLTQQISAGHYLKCHQRLTTATLRLITAVSSTAPKCPLEYKLSISTLLNLFDSRHLSPSTLSELLAALGSLVCSAEEQLLIWRALRDKGLFRVGARWTAIAASTSSAVAETSSAPSSALSNEIFTSLPEHCLQECKMGTFDITTGLLKYLLGAIKLITPAQQQRPVFSESGVSGKSGARSASSLGASQKGPVNYNPFDSTAVAAAKRAEGSTSQNTSEDLVSPSEALFRDASFRAVIKFVVEDVICTLHRRAFLRGSNELYEIAALGLSLLNEVLVATTSCGPSAITTNNRPWDELTNSVVEALFGGVGLNAAEDDTTKSFIQYMIDEDRKSAELARKAAQNASPLVLSTPSTDASSNGTNGNVALLPKQSTAAAFSSIMATTRAPNDTLNTVLRLLMEAVAAIGGGRSYGSNSAVNRDELTPFRIVAIRIALQLLVTSMTVMKSNKALANSTFTFNARTFDSTDFVIALLELSLIGDPVITRRAVAAVSLVDPRVSTRAVQALLADTPKERTIAVTFSKILRDAYETTVGASRRQSLAAAIMQARVRGGVLLSDDEIRAEEEQVDVTVDLEEDYLLAGLPVQIRHLGKEVLFQHCTPSVAHAVVSLLTINASCPAPSLTSWICGLENAVTVADSFVAEDRFRSAAEGFGLGAILSRVNDFYFSTNTESAALAAKYLHLVLKLFANKCISVRAQFHSLISDPQNVKFLRMVQVLSTSASLLSNPLVANTLRPAPTTNPVTSFLSLGKGGFTGGEGEKGLFRAAKDALLGGVADGISIEDRISTSATITLVYMLEFAGYAMQIAAMHVQSLAAMGAQRDTRTISTFRKNANSASVLARSEDPIAEFVRKLIRVPSATELQQQALGHCAEVSENRSAAVGADNVFGNASDDNVTDEDEEDEWTIGQAEAFAHIPGSWNSTPHNSVSSMEFGLRLWYTLSCLPNFPSIHLPLRGGGATSSTMIVNTNNNVPQFSVAAVHQLLVRENPSMTPIQLREKLRVYVYANSCLLSYVSACQFSEGWAAIIEVASFVTQDHAKELVPSHILSTCTNITSSLPLTAHFTVSAQVTIANRLTNALVSLTLKLSRALDAASTAAIKTLLPAINDLVEHVVSALIRFGNVSSETRENLYNALHILLSLPGASIVGTPLVTFSEQLFAMILADCKETRNGTRKMQIAALNTLGKLFTSRDLVMAFAVSKRQQDAASGAVASSTTAEGSTCLADLTLGSRNRLGLKANLLLDSYDIDHAGGNLTPNMVMSSPSRTLTEFISTIMAQLSASCVQFFTLSLDTAKSHREPQFTRCLAKFLLEFAMAVGNVMKALAATVPQLVFLANGSCTLGTMQCWAAIAIGLASGSMVSLNPASSVQTIGSTLKDMPSVELDTEFVRMIDYDARRAVAVEVMTSFVQWVAILIRDPVMQRNEECVGDIARFITSNQNLITFSLAAGAVSPNRSGHIYQQDLKLAESVSQLMLHLSSAPSQSATAKNLIASLKIMDYALIYSSHDALHSAAYVSNDPLFSASLKKEDIVATAPGASHLSLMSRINRNLAMLLMNAVMPRQNTNQPAETQKGDTKPQPEVTVVEGKTLFSSGGSKRPIVAAAPFILPESSIHTCAQLFPLLSTAFFPSLIMFARQMFVFSVKALSHASGYLDDLQQRYNLHSSKDSTTSSNMAEESSSLLFGVDVNASSRSVLLGRKSILPSLLRQLMSDSERDFNMKIEQLPHICLQTLGSLIMLLHLTVVECATHIRFGVKNDLLLDNQQGANVNGFCETDPPVGDDGKAKANQCFYQPSYLHSNPFLQSLHTTITEIHDCLCRSVFHTSERSTRHQQQAPAPATDTNTSFSGGVGSSRMAGHTNGGADAPHSAPNNKGSATLGDFVKGCSGGSAPKAAAHVESNTIFKKSVISPTTGCAAHDSRSAILDDADVEDGNQRRPGVSAAASSVHSNFYLTTAVVEGNSPRATPLTHDQYKHMRRVQAMLENAHRDVERLGLM